MKVLLLNPDSSYQKHHPLVFKGFQATLPLGLAYIAGVLERDGHQVRILDFQIEDYNLSHELATFQPDLAGISVCSPSARNAFHLARELKKLNPSLPIVAGSHHISVYEEEIFSQTDDFDILSIGESEETMAELVSVLSGGGELSAVKGIIFKENGEVIKNEPREFLKDLDQLPFVPLHLFEIKRYRPLPGTFTRLPNMVMITTRGCPYHCTFCNKSIWGGACRFRSALNVVEEIELAVRNFGIREIYFCDDTFTLKRKRVIEFCEELLRRNLKVGWKCCARVDTVDREILRLMKRAGCFLITFGAESGSDEMLRRIKKGITTDQIRNAFQLAREEKIQRGAFFMLNIPGDTIETTEATISFSREIKPDFLHFEFIKPFPGIPMRQEIEENPRCTINHDLWNSWEDFTVGNKLFFTQEGLSEEYLRDAYNHAVKDFYLRPGYILKSFGRLKSWAQFDSYFKTALNLLTVKVIS